MSSRCAGRVAATLVMLTALATAAAIAGPGEAGRGRRTATDRDGADFLVLVWYRGDDALGTFAYQSYDLRRGEYTPAVDGWLKLMREKYPYYVLRVLPVHLDRERGATEKLKVGSVIHRELLLAAARSGIVLGGPMRVGPGPSATPRPSSRAGPGIGMPGAGGSTDINPVGPSTPFPMPYPRPHP